MLSLKTNEGFFRIILLEFCCTIKDYFSLYEFIFNQIFVFTFNFLIFNDFFLLQFLMTLLK